MPKAKQIDEAAMVRDQNNWPQWPFLPLKSRAEKEHGLPIAGTYIGPDMEDGTHKVYLCLMFTFKPDAPKRVYQSVGDMLKDWMVD